MPTFDHYKQVIPAGFQSLAFIHSTVTVPDVQICTFGYGAVGEDNIDEADLTDLVTAWVVNVMPLLTDEMRLDRVTVSDADGVFLDRAVNEPGGNVGEGVPLTIAAIWEKRTGVAGRRNKGRMYVPCLIEGEIDQAGNILPLPLDAFQGVADDFFAAVVAADPVRRMHILHSKGWNDPDPEPADPGNAPAPTEVTSLVVKQKIGTQRRRIR